MLKECDRKKEIIIFGDVNCNWSNESDTKRLKEMTDKFNLTVTFPFSVGVGGEG